MPKRKQKPKSKKSKSIKNEKPIADGLSLNRLFFLKSESQSCSEAEIICRLRAVLPAQIFHVKDLKKYNEFKKDLGFERATNKRNNVIYGFVLEAKTPFSEWQNFLPHSFLEIFLNLVFRDEKFRTIMTNISVPSSNSLIFKSLMTEIFRCQAQSENWPQPLFEFRQKAEDNALIVKINPFFYTLSTYHLNYIGLQILEFFFEPKSQTLQEFNDYLETNLYRLNKLLVKLYFCYAVIQNEVKISTIKSLMSTLYCLYDFEGLKDTVVMKHFKSYPYIEMDRFSNNKFQKKKIIQNKPGFFEDCTAIAGLVKEAIDSNARLTLQELVITLEENVPKMFLNKEMYVKYGLTTFSQEELINKGGAITEDYLFLASIVYSFDYYLTQPSFAQHHPNIMTANEALKKLLKKAVTVAVNLANFHKAIKLFAPKSPIEGLAIYFSNRQEDYAIMEQLRIAIQDYKTSMANTNFDQILEVHASLMMPTVAPRKTSRIKSIDNTGFEIKVFSGQEIHVNTKGPYCMSVENSPNTFVHIRFFPGMAQILNNRKKCIVGKTGQQGWKFLKLSQPIFVSFKFPDVDVMLTTKIRYEYKVMNSEERWLACLLGENKMSNLKERSATLIVPVLYLKNGLHDIRTIKRLQKNPIVIDTTRHWD